MAYIPESHEKYNLLSWCNKNGREVFSYPSSLEGGISSKLPEGEDVIPYGYNSYAEFDEQLDLYIEQYGTLNGEISDFGQLIIKYKEIIHKMNVKENWSVLKYLGESTNNVTGLTHGEYYYWPCSIEHPEYEGIITNNEFTSYIAWAIESPEISDEYEVIKGGKFAPNACTNTWEIAEDPTGMAAKVLSGEIDMMGIKQKR